MRNFFKQEGGATLVEYGVALVLAITVGVGGLTLLAGDVGEQMGSACDVMSVTPTASPSVTC